MSRLCSPKNYTALANAHNQHEGLLAAGARLAPAIDSPAIDSGRVASLLPFGHRAVLGQTGHRHVIHADGSFLAAPPASPEAAIAPCRYLAMCCRFGIAAKAIWRIPVSDLNRVPVRRYENG